MNKAKPNTFGKISRSIAFVGPIAFVIERTRLLSQPGRERMKQVKRMRNGAKFLRPIQNDKVASLGATLQRDRLVPDIRRKESELDVWKVEGMVRLKTASYGQNQIDLM